MTTDTDKKDVSEEIENYHIDDPETEICGWCGASFDHGSEECFRCGGVVQ